MKATIRSVSNGLIEVSVEGSETTLVGASVEVENAPTQKGALIWVDTKDDGTQVLYVGDEEVDAPLVRYLHRSVRS